MRGAAGLGHSGTTWARGAGEEDRAGLGEGRGFWELRFLTSS